MVSETIEKTVIRIEADVKNALNEIDKVKREIGGVETETDKASSGTGKASVAMKAAWAAVGAAVVAATAAVTAFTISAVKASSQVEQYLVSLGVLYRSEQAAAEQMQWIFEFAKSTPFEVSGLVDATIKLKAFGLEAQNVLEVLGDTAAATSKPIEQVINAYGRLNVGDTGQAIAMFRDIGINLKNIEELEFDARGALVTPLEQAMPLVKQYLKEEFGGLMQAQSETAKGIGSNIKDSMYQAGLAVMGFEATADGAGFRDGSIFAGIKDTLQIVLNALNSINFDAIGKQYEANLATIMNVFDDLKRGMEGIDLSGFVKSFEMVNTVSRITWETLDKYNVFEYIGMGIRAVINLGSDFQSFIIDVWVAGINLMIDSYNKLVPLLQKVGVDIDYINRLSADDMLSGFLRKADDEAKRTKDSVDDVVKSVTELSDVSSNTKMPGWAGQSDYIRERLKETGGRNIGDLLGMAGVSSNIGGNQTVGSLTSVNNNQNIVNPNASLVDINRTGFNTIASKLDSVVNAVNNININVSSGGRGGSVRTTGDIMKEQAIADQVSSRVIPRWL